MHYGASNRRSYLGRLLRFTPLIFTIAIVAVFVLLAAAFARVQTLWIDETTQLSGLTLDPLDQLRWLAGDDAHRFGVPPDRQPPLSYFMGWAWSQVFGLSQMTMRFFGVVAVAIAGLFIAATGYRSSGRWGGPLACGLFLLSPNIIGIAPEIRPYPVFLLWASIGLWCLSGYARAMTSNRGPWLWGLSAACLAASYTHYYGGIMGIALLSAALLVAWRNKNPTRQVFLAGALYVILSLGLIPFIASAFRISASQRVLTNSGAYPV